MHRRSAFRDAAQKYILRFSGPEDKMARNFHLQVRSTLDSLMNDPEMSEDYPDDDQLDDVAGVEQGLSMVAVVIAPGESFELDRGQEWRAVRRFKYRRVLPDGKTKIVERGRKWRSKPLKIHWDGEFLSRAR
jgi:hypothetical protein